MRIVMLTLLAAVSVFAQGTRAKLPNEQWVQLFNGKDFTGWVKVGNEQWTVEDGTIHGQGVTKDEIAALIDARGGMLVPFSGYNSFGLRAKCLSQDAATFVDLMADCLVNQGDMVVAMRGAVAALSQVKVFPGDIDAAKSFLRVSLDRYETLQDRRANREKYEEAEEEGDAYHERI